jgi:putative ABC transport system permease protein
MSWLAGVGQRVRELLRPSALDADLDAELQQHVDHELNRQLASGVSEEEARRRARLRVGRLDLTREAVAEERSGRVLADAARDARFAIRALRRSPAFTAAVVISLALGVGGTTAIFGVVYSVLLRPLNYPNADDLHIVSVWWNDFDASPSAADLFALREHHRGVAEVGAYFLPDNGFAMATREGPQLIDGGLITDELPGVLGVPLLLGPGFSADRSLPELLISEPLWHERFGGRPDAIGKPLTVDGDTCAIVGVMPAGFHLPGQLKDQIWVRPILKRPTRRGPFFMTVVARLAPGVSREQAETRLTTAVKPVMREEYAVKDHNWRYGLRSVKETLTGKVGETLWLTFAAVGLVLLIAVANVANLLLARGTVRARELAVRASLGAGRGRLARQLLAESALLGLLGGGCGLLLAFVFVRGLRAAAEIVMPGLPLVQVDVVMVTFAIATGVAAGVLAGVLPLLRLPWQRLGEWLREGGRTAAEGRRHGHARRVLVVAEIALTLTVLTGASLLVKSLVNLQSVDPGFRGDGVVTFRVALPDKPYDDEKRLSAFMRELATGLRALPGVRAVAMSSFLPVDQSSWTNNYTVEGQSADSRGADGVAQWNVVDTQYFDALGIHILRGRAFDGSDQADAPLVAIVNETFARRHFPNGDAIGRRIKGGDWDPKYPWTTIVGVASDVAYGSALWDGTGETFYTAFEQNLWLRSSYVVLKVAGGDPTSLVPAAGKIVASRDSRVPLRDVSTMNERLRLATAIPRFRGLLFSLLGVLALALAITGIYGVMAYHVNQRRRETAIRRALGASVGQVVSMVLASGMRLALTGVVLGAVGALLTTRSLSSLLFRVDPRDPSVLIASAVLVTLAGFVACALPAMRAGRTDPAAILRDE